MRRGTSATAAKSAAAAVCPVTERVTRVSVGRRAEPGGKAAVTVTARGAPPSSATLRGLTASTTSVGASTMSSVRGVTAGGLTFCGDVGGSSSISVRVAAFTVCPLLAVPDTVIVSFPSYTASSTGVSVNMAVPLPESLPFGIVTVKSATVS